MSGNERAAGVVFVLSAPSGTGKTTVAERLLATTPALEFSVSYTTRPPRAGERDGADYHFVDDRRFDAMVEGREFLEWAPVFDRRYGTGLEATRRALGRGVDLLLDIDVQGARQVRQADIPAVLVMLLPPDYATLERRLRGRDTEDARVQERRLAEARAEVEAALEFDYVVVNQELDPTVEALASIVRAERRRASRRSDEIRQIVGTFPPAVGGRA